MRKDLTGWEAGKTILKRYGIILYEYYRGNVCHLVVKELIPKNTFAYMIAVGWEFHPGITVSKWTYEPDLE